jgi:thiol-disulfide isomerase/thioredoxin
MLEKNYSAMPPQLPKSRETIASVGVADYDWSIQRLDGVVVQFAQFAGKVTFLYLWENWCTPCRVEIPRIAALFDRFRNEPNVAFVLVSHMDIGLGDRCVDIGAFDLPFYCRTSYLPEVFDGPIMPRAFILDSDGSIVFRQIRPAKWDDECCVEFMRRLIRK